MVKWGLLLLFLCLALYCGAIHARKSNESNKIINNFSIDPPTTVPPHPRLFLLDSDLPIITQQIPPNSWAKPVSYY